LRSQESDNNNAKLLRVVKLRPLEI
jgi:hypothetical protein